MLFRGETVCEDRQISTALGRCADMDEVFDIPRFGTLNRRAHLTEALKALVFCVF